MIVFEVVLALLLGGVLLSLLAPRLGVPWPALLALAGAGLALVPGMPDVTLDPHLALALFIAPVLLDSAFDASPRDLRANWLPLGGLVLVAVVLTVGAVAATARWMNPGLPWAAAAALGAIVAPPDAAAATSVLRQMRLPHRMMVVLEGEGMLNDASALLVFRVALLAAAGSIGAWTAPMLLAEVAGGVVLGFAFASFYVAASARLPEGPASVTLQFIGTFGVWLLAEQVAVSPILTVVSYAMTIARAVPGRTGARHRRYAYAVWDVMVFVLNVLAFMLIGLQLRGIVGRLDGRFWDALGFAAAVLGIVVVVRLLWVSVYGSATRLLRDPNGDVPLPTLAGGVVIGWCGMRGIVTLATALALPADFPERDLLVFTAFVVVLGTLVLQGMTLRPLLAVLNLPEDDSVAREVALGRVEAARAVLDELGDELEGDEGRPLRLGYRARLDPEAETTDAVARGAVLRKQALAAERRALLRLRGEGRIGDDAYHQLEEELDWMEAEAAPNA